VTFPVFDLNPRLAGLLSAVDLSTAVPIPPHHNITPVGDDARSTADYFVLLHFVDAVFLSEAVLVSEDHYAMTTQSCHTCYLEANWETPLNVTCEHPMYESAICIAHEDSSDFGHWFLEVLPAYAVLPRNIMSSFVVVVPEAPPDRRRIRIPRDRRVSDRHRH
jgi:hypothetical protein